jgi:hypothetical protein
MLRTEVVHKDLKVVFLHFHMKLQRGKDHMGIVEGVDVAAAVVVHMGCLEVGDQDLL